MAERITKKQRQLYNSIGMLEKKAVVYKLVDQYQTEYCRGSYALCVWKKKKYQGTTLKF